MARCKASDPLRYVTKQISEGSLESLKDVITQDIQPVLKSRLTSTRVPRNRSPMIMAVQHKKRDIVEYLLDTYEVNIEQETSTIIEGGHPVEGATPLWTASTLGLLDIVKLLVERGADIEHTTDSHSSPLRGAAFDGHIEVVEYLVKQGADIDKPNQVGQSPLTIAAAMKQLKTVQFLIANGANVHHKGHNGDMPLHVAVESGSSDVTKILVDSGAKNVPNDIGYTPAILACCYGHHDILQYLHSQFHLEEIELYNCYCLLVSKEILNSDVTAALDWCAKAITLRSRNSFPISTSHPIYDGVQEPTTMDEARIILQDNVKSFFLCAVYCERVLGPVHPTTPFYIRISGDMALDEQVYDKCMQLWLRSLEYDEAARMAYELQIIEDMLFSIRGFAIMIEAAYVPRIVQHFDWGIKEFTLSRASKISESDVIYCLCRMLAVWLMAIDASKDTEYKANEMITLRKCVKKLIDVTNEKEPPLLISCLSNIGSSTNTQRASTALTHCRLPLHRVVSLLLDYGCPLNSENDSGNYPLHLAVILREDSSYGCVKTLVEAGVHLDAVNYDNQTAFDLANVVGGKFDGFAGNRSSISSYLLTSSVKHNSLQCNCAKALIKYKIPYKKILPTSLIAFVSEHEAIVE